MAESEDVNSLKRRGRRRLVGAIALVLAAVIVLPMVFDSEPRNSAPPVSVRIPGEEESGFAPKAVQKAPDKAPEKVAEKAPEKVAEKAAEKAPEPIAEKAPEPAVEKPAPKIEIKVTKAVPPAPAAPAPVAPAKAEAVSSGESFVIQVGAFADPEKIKEVVGKLKGARIPFYTEQVAVKSGLLTRVRAGPFDGRDAADRVQQRLKDLGLKPGNVAAK